MDYHYPYYSLLGPWAEGEHYGNAAPIQQFYQHLPEETVIDYMNDHLRDLTQDEIE